jgi:hypothetical protein
MKIFKKIIVAAGTLFGLAVSLSLLQRKTLLLTGRITFQGNKKNEEAEEIKLDKVHSIRKISGNNEGFVLFKNKGEFFKISERNPISAVGMRLEPGSYKVSPLNGGGKRTADIVIELVE